MKLPSVKRLENGDIELINTTQIINRPEAWFLYHSLKAEISTWGIGEVKQYVNLVKMFCSTCELHDNILPESPCETCSYPICDTMSFINEPTNYTRSCDAE